MCEASECSHVCEDLHAIRGGRARVLVDPTVHVAYDQGVYEEMESQGWWKGLEGVRMGNASERVEEVRRRLEEKEKEARKAGPTTWDCCDLQGRCHRHRVRPWKGGRKRTDADSMPWHGQ